MAVMLMLAALMFPTVASAQGAVAWYCSQQFSHDHTAPGQSMNAMLSTLLH